MADTLTRLLPGLKVETMLRLAPLALLGQLACSTEDDHDHDHDHHDNSGETGPVDAADACAVLDAAATVITADEGGTEVVTSDEGFEIELPQDVSAGVTISIPAEHHDVYLHFGGDPRPIGLTGPDGTEHALGTARSNDDCPDTIVATHVVHLHEAADYLFTFESGAARTVQLVVELR